MEKIIPFLSLLFVFLFSTHSAISHAEDITIGMSTALTGPAQALGGNMQKGINAHFLSVNKQGGVKGRALSLLALDDGYEPSRAAPNMHQLIAKKDILAIAGNVGTPTAIVTVPIANQSKTVLFGAFTGAGVLRQTPPDRYVINYRASYAEETAAMINGLLEAGIKPEEIAFFTQNDGYGDAGYNGAVDALKKKGFEQVEKLAHGRYTRNTLNVEEALGVMFDVDVEPKAIIMVGAYAPCAKFIKLAKQEFPETIFLNVSFVGSVALKEALGKDAEDVIITQVVPHFKSDLPLVKEYRKDMQTHFPDAEPGFVSLEGYIVARILTQAMTGLSSVDRESLVDGLEGLGKFDIGLGVPLSLSKSEHQASHQVWPTIIKNNQFEPLKDWKLDRLASR